MIIEKTKYIEPEIEVVKFGSMDIITASAEWDFGGTDPWHNDVF